MNANETTNTTETKQGSRRWGGDAGGAAAGVVAALVVIAVGLGVAAVLKFTVFKDDSTSNPKPHVTVTAGPSTPAASHTPATTPTVNAEPFTGLWSGIVTGDYTPGYTATVDITQNGQAITGDVNYTYVGDASHEPMDCTGSWSGTVDQNYADIHETMQGTRCSSEVDLRLQLNGNGTILMQILYVNDSHHPVATLTQIGDD
jgi:hypothetical protein